MENIGWKLFLKNRIEGLEKDIPWFLHDKIKCHNFCIDNNIPSAIIYDIFNNVEDITFNNISEMEFILKPTLESSTKGVMVLRREDRNYYDSLSKKHYTFDEIISLQSELFNKNKNKANKIILEQKIYDENESKVIPRDFKFYTFNGQIAAILQIDRNVKPVQVTWYDSEFELMDDDKVWSNPRYVNLIRENNRPSKWEEMLNNVVEISKNIKTPFASIDMYCTKTGPILGEVTLAPGGLYHGVHYLLSDEENMNWGSYWVEALKRLDTMPKTSKESIRE